MSETGITPTPPAAAPTGVTAAPLAQVPPPPVAPAGNLEPHKVGMACFLVSEAAFFSTLIMAYVWFLGKSQTGPTPAETLTTEVALGGTTWRVPNPVTILGTVFLLASSATAHFADRALRHRNGTGFPLFWGVTILLGVAFLAATAFEWNDLIFRHKLTISRNLFGTTYYTLVGFHALHVTIGVVVMLIVLGLVLRRQVTPRNPLGVELVSWYWHFVDGVWVVVFTVVYLIGR